MSNGNGVDSSEKTKGILTALKNGKNREKIIVFIVIVLVVIFVAVCFFPQSKSESIDSDDYVFYLESKLSETLSKIDGAGKVSVMITVESGMETVLASKVTTTELANGKKEITETPIIVNGKTVTLKESYPKITGVLIVAEGANSISVINKLQQATLSVLDVDIQNVEILTMK